MEFHAVWDFRIAIDLFLGGVGIGTFLLCAYFSFIKKESSLMVIRIGFLLAPILVGLGVLSLLTELGKPFRMLSTFINVNPTSVTSWGGFLQSIFILISIVLFYIVFRYKQESFQKPVFKGLVIAGAFFALTVGVYHGLLLMSLGRPGWANGLIPVMFLVSSLLCGSSILMIIEELILKSHSSIMKAYAEIAATVATDSTSSSNLMGFRYSKLLFNLIVIQTLLIVTWRISIVSSGTEAIFAYQNLIDQFGVYWWIFVIGIGLLIPLLIASYYTFRKQKMNLYSSMILTVFVLVGSYAFKHIILYSGQIPLGGL